MLWGDSDIPYLHQLSDPKIMENSISMGILNSKIGAIITDKVQPMDVDSGFKIIKTAARTTTLIGENTPLTTVVNHTFDNMRNNNKLKLPSHKESIIKDCVLSSPEILSKSYSSDTIMKSYVSSGMLDVAT